MMTRASAERIARASAERIARAAYRIGFDFGFACGFVAATLGALVLLALSR